MKVEDEDRVRALLLDNARAFFEGTREPTQLAGLVYVSMKALGEGISGLADRGVLTPEVGAMWSWCSTVVPAIARVVALGPKYGTRELEVQLFEAFRDILRSSPSRTVQYAEHLGEAKPTEAVKPPFKPTH